MQTMLAQTGPEVKRLPLPTEPKLFDDGSAYWPSKTRPGLCHTLFASLIGGRMVVTECSCEAGSKQKRYWHRDAYQAELDKQNGGQGSSENEAAAENEAAIEQAALAAADFERAYARKQMEPGNADAALACREAHGRLEAARAQVRAFLPGRKGN